MFQRVLQKQASLNKRLSAVSALAEPEPAAQQNSHATAVVAAAPQSTKSHTETAV